MKARHADLKKIMTLSHQGRYDLLRQGSRKNSAIKSWVTEAFILNILTKDTPEIGLAISASKKTAASAVLRNRMRRRLKSVAADILPAHISPGHDVMMIARAAAHTRDYETMKKDLLWALTKLGLAREAL
jgi:ribonuclease P protein component